MGLMGEKSPVFIFARQTPASKKCEFIECVGFGMRMAGVGAQ